MTKSTNPIPKGYKLTKIGVLPVEWEVVKLENILSKIESGTSVNCSIGSESDKRILKTSAVTLGAFLPSETKTPIVDEEDKLSTQVKAGHILVCRKNSPSLVGSSVLVESLDQDLFLPDLLWQLIPNENYREISNFLFYALNEGHTAFRIRNLASGSSESMRNISKKSYLNLSLPLPPLPQQQKIAQILATWDQAIQTQTQLINAKKELKRGLMQQLLTGEVRLPGFEGVWESTRMNKILRELKKDKVENAETFELVTVKLYCKGIELTGKSPRNTEKGRPYYFREPGEILVGRQNFHNGGIGRVPDFGKKVVASNAISSFKALETVNTDFLLHAVMNPNFYRKVGHLIGGTGQKEVSRKEFSNLRLKLPSIPEQTAIANILTTADREITLLETRLTELREQKRGLMQRLLTGAVRVTVPATA
jgi:type I restriction enzyme S subunit